ncbi:peptidylprolyl isomerase [Gammaproteobacteria bacterium]|nr:peptidylprolyl isomerase [Gammaproteobacteria bacterium]
MITLHTNYGDITIELDFANTPNTANNFLKLAKDGYYDECIFHRVINGFMVQGGGFNAKMESKDHIQAIKNEANNSSSNTIGTLAMARTSDPHSASTQFFINVANNTFLDFKSETESGWGYCVFGKVTEGMDNVDKIKNVSTTNKAGHQDVPVEPVEIKSITINDGCEIKE